MGVSGSAASKKVSPPEADEGVEIAKALSLITGLVESPKDVRATLLKLQTATRAAKEESDRLLKARTADGFMKEAARVRATAREKLAEAEEKAKEIIKDAQDRIKEALKKTERERVEFEDERDQMRKAVNAKMSSLSKRDDVLREKEAATRDAMGKAKRESSEAVRVKVACATMIKRLREVLKDD